LLCVFYIRPFTILFHHIFAILYKYIKCQLQSTRVESNRVSSLFVILLYYYWIMYVKWKILRKFQLQTLCQFSNIDIKRFKNHISHLFMYIFWKHCEFTLSSSFQSDGMVCVNCKNLWWSNLWWLRAFLMAIKTFWCNEEKPQKF
jgi:hypothetical protein